MLDPPRPQRISLERGLAISVVLFFFSEVVVVVALSSVAAAGSLLDDEKLSDAGFGYRW